MTKHISCDTTNYVNDHKTRLQYNHDTVKERDEFEPNRHWFVQTRNLDFDCFETGGSRWKLGVYKTPRDIIRSRRIGSDEKHVNKNGDK